MLLLFCVIISNISKQTGIIAMYERTAISRLKLTINTWNKSAKLVSSRYAFAWYKKRALQTCVSTNKKRLGLMIYSQIAFNITTESFPYLKMLESLFYNLNCFFPLHSFRLHSQRLELNSCLLCSSSSLLCWRWIEQRWNLLAL